MKHFKNLLFVSAVTAGLSQTAPAAVTFTNTPTAVSNTYNGVITLQIGGLTNTETVVVQKFLDANTNGAVSSGDLLVQQFRLTDGQATVFSGVTNLNVPGDLNSTTGAITAQLAFEPASANGDIVQELVGKYLFKLSSPGGHFAPITNSFAVTNFPFAQSIGGIVRSNTLAVSNAIVILFSSGASGDLNPLYGAVADNSGNYAIKAPPGNYLPVAFRSNYLANLNTSPTIVLTSGFNVTTNLNLTNATQTLSGKIVDTNTPGIGLPGILVPLTSTNNFIGIGFSDTNGNFVVGTRPSVWKVNVEGAGLELHGYLSTQNSIKTNTAAGSVSGVTNALPKATAMFYGRIQDNNNNPMPGVGLFASDSFGMYEDNPASDQNGNYFAGVLAGTWNISIDDRNPTLSNFVFTEGMQATFNAGDAVQVNFYVLPAPNHITGTVKDSNNNSIAGVGVFAQATINGTNYQSVTAVTDNNGNYSFNVANGNWSVGVFCNGGDNSLDNLLGNGNYACPNNQNAGIAGNNATNNFTVQLCGGILINTASLPVGEVNVPYDQFLQASSCAGGYNWTKTAGSLPGLSLFSNGELTGTPNSGGVFNFTAQVTDGGALSTNKQFSLIISNALQVTTTTLPNGTNGQSYSQQLQAIAGVPFAGASLYDWSLASGSVSLPANLNLATNGLLSGALTAGGTFNFTVEVADSLGATFDQPLSLTVITTNLPPLTIGTGGKQIIVFWPLSAGTNFTVQMTTNLETGPWVPATNGVPAIALTFTNTAPAAFFRLQ